MYLILAVNSWSTAKTEELDPLKISRYMYTIVQSEGNWPGRPAWHVCTLMLFYIHTFISTGTP